MGLDNYGLPDDGEPDYAAQLQEERGKREAAERELASLKAQRGDQARQSSTATPTAAPVDYARVQGSAIPAELAGLNARLRDPSVDWPTLRRELLAHGFQEPGI